ncbi:IS5 family transposase [Xanthomonas oryzae]|uniref:IS5 family transposase n=1 Tax=Xanthomonas oryzae TaxID=347 RepID=UPI002223485E|nr:IS5 family transposase [Xanthomonas oryzae]
MQRGNVSMTNLQVVNALLYVAEHGCKWRGLPERFGNWHTVYTRINRWAKSGVLDRMFAQLQTCQIVRIKIEAVSLDSTSIKVHPDGTGAFKKNGPQSIGKSRGGWNTKIHMVAADARTAITFGLTPGNAHDAPAGRALLEHLGPVERPVHLLMDRAYEDNETRKLALDLSGNHLTLHASHLRRPTRAPTRVKHVAVQRDRSLPAGRSRPAPRQQRWHPPPPRPHPLRPAAIPAFVSGCRATWGA